MVLAGLLCPVRNFAQSSSAPGDDPVPLPRKAAHKKKVSTVHVLLDVANPEGRVARWFFYGFVTLAVAGFAAFAYGMSRIKREDVQVTQIRDELPRGSGIGLGRGKTIFAKTRGVQVDFHESLAPRDLIPGLRARDPRVIGFALRGGGLLFFVLSTFLALGTGMLVCNPEDEGGGWVFIGFVVLWVSVMGYRVATAPPDNPPPDNPAQ